MGHDGRIALADTRGLDNDQIKPYGFATGDDVGQRRADFRAEFPRRQRPHEDPLAVAPWGDGVHADAVTQQGAATLASAGVD